MIAAQLGLEPSPVTGQAALVPFKNNKKGGIYEAQFQIMYKGLLSLVRRSGELQSVQAQVVYEQDAFSLQYGLEEKLEHIPAEGERGKIKGAYVVFRYKDGGHSFDYMSSYDIDKIRKRSKAKDDGPWVTDYAEMAKKTIIKRHCKLAPVSIEMQTATALDDRIQIGESQMDLLGVGDPIDVEQGEESAPELEGNADIYWEIHGALDQKGQYNLLVFTDHTAEANGITATAVQFAVTPETRDAFLAQFRAWQKEQNPEPNSGDGPAPTDQEKHDWETIKGMKTKGFTAYMDAVGVSPGDQSPWMTANLNSKCRAIFNMTLLEKLSEYAEPERDPATGATNGEGPLIECPNMKEGERIYQSECEHCQDRQNCPTHD